MVRWICVRLASEPPGFFVDCDSQEGAALCKEKTSVYVVASGRPIGCMPWDPRIRFSNVPSPNLRREDANRGQTPGTLWNKECWVTGGHGSKLLKAARAHRTVWRP